MAKNDTLLLDGIIDERVEQEYPSKKRDECFEFLAFEQILKDEDLSIEEINSGIVDGRGDGGIDGFYVFINGHLLQDLDDFVWPKSNVELKVAVVTCKHHDTFKQATLDSAIATFSEFFDFTINNSELAGKYNAPLLNVRSNLIYAIRKISSRLKKMDIDVFYASRGDTTCLGDEVVSRAAQIAKILENNFSNGNVKFSFLGSTELLKLFRKVKNYTLELPFKEILSRDERYVVLANLKDYFNFISENKILKKHIFDANVRSFMGLNNVNEDIKYTLEKGGDDFWLLNNGVTILVTSASIIGKSLQASDVQIVNGLQTSQSIFNFFNSELGDNSDDRCILVKVIVTKDGELRDKIIKATNNQTNVEISSLHATDKIQRDIEEILLKENLYYERRKNYYINQGVGLYEIISPLYLASAFVCLVLKKPEKNGLKSKFMRSEEQYNLVFDTTINLNIWPALAKIYKKTDLILEKIRPKRIGNEKFLKRWRNLVSFLIISRFYKKFSFNVNQIVDFDFDSINEESAKEIYDITVDLYPDAKVGNILNSKNLILNISIAYSKMYVIEDIGMIIPENKIIDEFDSNNLNDNFLEKVRAILPPQPWKPRMERRLIKELTCSRENYFSAVRKLIDMGEFYDQKDGVLYDKNGNIVGIDDTRVDKVSFKLKENPS